MGDRCYVTVAFRKENRDIIEEILRCHDYIAAGDTWVMMGADEMNYGAQNEIADLIGKHPEIPFIAWHDAGVSYGPYCIVHSNGMEHSVEWPIFPESYLYPVVTVYPGGVMDSDLTKALGYIKHLQQAASEIGYPLK